MENGISKYSLVFEDGVYNNKSAIIAKGSKGTESEYKVPNVSAIYCLFSTKNDGQGGRCLNNLLYIGKTVTSNGFRQRCLQHLDTERNDYLHNNIDSCPDSLCWYTYSILDGRSLGKCEAAMIKQFKPPLNRNAPTHDGISHLEISGGYASYMRGEWTVSASDK